MNSFSVTSITMTGWISIGSLDGFLYSFSPTGVLMKFPKAAALDYAVQTSPLLDCSGYAVYISQTEMDGKISHMIGEYNYISALKPINVVFTLVVPATGSVYWSKTYLGTGQFSSLLSESDLQHFVLDERILLAFIAASKIDNPLSCRSTRQKFASSCSQAEPKRVGIYTGNERAILLFLLLESTILVRTLRLQKKAFDRTITELERKASEEAMANEMLEKLGDLVREKEGIERKLSTTYSLGRDRSGSNLKSLLPLYGGKTKSYSFQGTKKEQVTIFHTLSDASSSADSSGEREAESNYFEDKESAVKAKEKAKAPTEDGSSSDDEIKEDYEGTPLGSASSSKGLMNPLFVGHESKGVKMDDEREVRESIMQTGNRSIRRRTLSSTN
ncbi:hypothetical protein U1Q18_038791 [Sarracenia purpurea var. burkii]